MKILSLNAYFPPEVVAYTHLEKDIFDAACALGNTITVITPTPTRSVDKETADKYRNIKNESLEGGKINVVRFWAPQEKSNPIVRAFRYFWCNFREYSIAKKHKDADVIYAASTPPTQGLLCALLKKKLNKPFVYNLQDIFPDSLVTTGLTAEGSLIWKLGKEIEAFTYKHADKIIVISEGFKENIMAKGVSEEKIVVVPNWIDTDDVKPVEKTDNRIYEEYSIPRDKFIVVYAGNFGVAQGAEVVLKAAEELKETPDIHFAIFGGGSGFEEAKNFVLQKGLTNVTIHGLLPQDRISEVYSLGDVCLITCKKGVGKSGMPSKTWSIMACNTPIIASFDTDSEFAKIIHRSGAGVCCEPEDALALADAILKYKSDDKASNAREFVEGFASKKVCAVKYAQTINSCK